MRTKYNHNQLPDAINASPQSNFTMVPSEILRNPQLSGNAKTILGILLSNTKGWTTYITVLKTCMIEKETAIKNGITNLEQFGYLRRFSYVNKFTKSKVGSFWAYTTVPFNFNLEDHLRLLKKSNCELWKGSLKKYKNLTSRGTPPTHNSGDPYVGYPIIRISKDTTYPYKEDASSSISNGDKKENATNPIFGLKLFPKEFRKDPEFYAAWKALVKQRKEKGSKGKPLHLLPTTSIELTIKRLIEEGVEQATETVITAACQNYQGIAFAKKKQTNPPPKSAYKPKYTPPPNEEDEEDYWRDPEEELKKSEKRRKMMAEKYGVTVEEYLENCARNNGFYNDGKSKRPVTDEEDF